jgi:hypothetical protein
VTPGCDLMQEQDANVSAYPCLQGFWNMSYMDSRRVGIQELNASLRDLHRQGRPPLEVCTSLR